MAKRIQSPTSINMYKRCPRKYYLHYLLKKPIKPNIHLYRGSIVHAAINNFDSLEIKPSDESDYPLLRERLIGIFHDQWKKNEKDIEKLNLPEKEIRFYYNESIEMLDNWLSHFIEETARAPPCKTREVKLFSSPEYCVMGILDLIQERNGFIEIIDYKTSKAATITEEYLLQLALYALLYEEKFKKTPVKVGIHFLKFKDGIRMIDVDEKLINLAKREAKMIQLNTLSDDPSDYPCTCGGFCKRDFQ